MPASGILVKPSATRRLSDGIIVEASIVGRLLGIRLLRLNADIVIAPAETVAPERAPTYEPFTGAAPNPPSWPQAPRAQPVRHGDALADAVRLIREGAATLDEARAVRPRR